MDSETFIVCQYQTCKSIFERPVLLYCCGESICEKHVNDLYTDNKKSKIKCCFCTKEIEVPQWGVSSNKVIDKLLTMDFGESYKQAKENCSMLKQQSRDLNRMLQESDKVITEHFQNIRKDIQSAKEEWRSIIDNYYEGVLKELESQENECKSNSTNRSSDTSFQAELDKKCDNFATELTKFSVDENKWQKLNENILKELHEAKIKFKETHASLLNNRIYKYNRPSYFNAENLFGKLETRHDVFDLVSCSMDKTIRLWNMESGKCLKSFSGHSGHVYCVKYFSDDIIISCCDNNTIKFWSLKTGKCTRTLSNSSFVYRIHILNDQEFVSGHSNGEIRLWNINEDIPIKVFLGHQRIVKCFELIPYRNELISCSEDGILKVWDLKSTTSESLCLKTIRIQSDKADIKLLPNNNEIVFSTKNCVIIRFDLNTSNFEKLFHAHDKPIWTIELLPNDRLVTGSEDKTIKIWSLTSRACLKVLVGNSYPITCLKVLSDGKIISGSSDQTIKIWSLDNFECIQTLNGHKNAVMHLELVPRS